MNDLPPLALHDGRPMADSRDVAVTFERQHKSVLRAFRDLDCSPDFGRRNFAPFQIKDLTGESLSHVLMTKDGFAYLALGFTGHKAARFKEAYIDRFNAMEAELASRAAVVLPGTFAEALQLAADKQREVEAQAARIAVLEPRSAALAAIADSDGTHAIRDAGKLLGLRESDFRDYLRANRWIFRPDTLTPWRAYADKIGAGWMTTKLVPVETGCGRPWNRPQARITNAGLVVLAQRLGKPIPPEAQLPLTLPAPARA